MSRKDIRELLDLKGWQQQQLAQALGVSKSTVCKWLAGAAPCAGPAKRLMQVWLDEARRAPKSLPPATTSEPQPA